MIKGKGQALSDPAADPITPGGTWLRISSHCIKVIQVAQGLGSDAQVLYQGISHPG